MGLHNHSNTHFTNPRARRLLLHRRDSSSLSTISVNDNEKNKIEESQRQGEDDNNNNNATRRRCPKSVHFAERKQVHVYNQRVSSSSNYNQVWYTADDFAQFQQQAEEDAAALREHRNGTVPVADTLLNVYCAFRAATSATQLLATLDDIDLPRALLETDDEDDNDTVGLVIAGLEQAQPEIAADFAVRRAHLLHQMARIQYNYNNCSNDNARCVQLMAETSRLTSRVSRMFAHYVAAAQQQQDEQQ